MPKSEKKCQEIRDKTRQKIIDKSILYFSRNGFSGTKISDLCKYIGIAPGSLYNYFESKEELYEEIKTISKSFNLGPMKKLIKLPMGANKKIRLLSQYLIRQLESDQMFAAQITLGTQELLADNTNKETNTAYESEAYKFLSIIVEQGQKENTVFQGDVMKLVDYYWSVVYLYALKKLFTGNFIMIDADDLSHTLIKE